jgi:phosphatidylglycerophosphatase A
MYNIYNKKIKILSLGFKPIVQSAFGAIIGALLAFIFCYFFPLWLRILLLFIIIGISIPLATRLEKFFKKKDTKIIFFDEIAGVLVATLPIRFSSISITLSQIFIALLIFGLLDSMKIFPANKIEHFSAGWGIVLDDIVAGIYTAIILLLIL